MVDFIVEHALPFALLILVPFVAAGLRFGAKKIRAHTRASETKADDQPGELVGNALDGAADAIDPKEGK